MYKKRQNADSDTIRVTPAMIKAGVSAYYEEAIWGWDNPGREELEQMMRAIFLAMSSARRQSPNHCHGAEIVPRLDYNR